MRVLITGVTGFVGSHLADLLVDAQVPAIGTSYEGRWRFGVGQSTRDSVPVRRWDITQSANDEFVAWVNEFDPAIVFHLAGASVPADCGGEEPNQHAVATNVRGTLNVLDLVGRLHSKPHVVVASSCHVYKTEPQHFHRVAESETPAPGNGYGKTKWLAEQHCQQFAKDNEVPLTILRGFQHTGPRQAARMLLPEWSLQLVRGGKDLEVRCLDTHLDLMDVRDTVRLYWELAQNPKGRRVLNVGTGVATSGTSVADELGNSLCRDLDVTSQHAGPRFNPVADTTEIEAVLGPLKFRSLRETVDDTLEFWRSVQDSK